MKFTFKLTFGNTNVTESGYTLKTTITVTTTTKMPNLLDLISLIENYRQLQFVKLLSERRRLPVKFRSHQDVFLEPPALYMKTPRCEKVQLYLTLS